jgi:tRNA dimethylallyltransferase
MSGLGYRQLGFYLNDEVSLEEAVVLIKKETRRFIRQQYNWFRLDDEKIQWFDVSGDFEPSVMELVRRFGGQEMGDE